MSYAISIPPGAGSSGTSGEFPTSDTLTIESDETTTDFNRTAGALKFKVTNAGIAGGGTDDIATVNGVNLFPGNSLEFEAKLDAANNIFYTLPAMTVVTNGATIWWYEER